VGRAAAEPPALVTLTWPGTGDGAAPPLALVGKGITFDTGGLCVKPAEGMERMKGDMGGAAAVLGTVHALASMQAACPVVGILAIAENAVGGSALRPGDVLRSAKGLTVEVIDTDAEGRLVLADALAHAATLRPRAVVDMATLTGSVVTALGRHMAGLFCADAALAAALRDLGDAVGEPLWPLPLTDAFDDDLKSDLADLLQCAPAGRFLPDALHAARFLQHFAPAGVPWAHLDIAGVAAADDDRPLSPKGATGFGVRLLTALAERLGPGAP
ncbi:MAG: leucyl aminopeptidase family protein, partial [Caenispirillum bisanense]|nr:leucyl aminopeptidase family protein [Caenispirillum bisanense]